MPPPEPTPTPSPQAQEPVTKDNFPGSIKSVAGSMIETPPEPTPEPKPQTPPEPPPTPPPEPAPGTPPPEPQPKPKDPNAPPDIPEGLIETPSEPPKPDDDFDPNSIKIEDLDEKVRPNFAKMRDKLNATQRDLETATKERDQLKTSQVGEITESEAYKELQTKNEQLLDLVARTNLSADPRFQAKYASMRQPIVDSIKAAVASYNVSELNPDEVVAFAESLTPKDRADWLSSQFPEELQSAAVASLLPMFAQFDIIQRSQEAELAAHKESKAVLDQQHKEQVTQQVVALREEAKNTALRDLSRTEFLLKRVEGNEDWNKSVDALNEAITATFNSQDPKVHAEALVSSALAPVYKAMFLREREQRLTYEKAIKDRNIALPEVGKTTQEPTPTPMKASDITVDSVVKKISGEVEAKFSG